MEKLNGRWQIYQTILAFFQVKHYDSNWSNVCYIVNDVYDINANVRIFSNVHPVTLNKNASKDIVGTSGPLL